MAAWSVARHWHRGRQSFGTRQIGGITSLLGRAPAARTQLLPNKEAARCSSPATNPAPLRGETCYNKSPRQELLWRQSFLDQTVWWDNRIPNKTSCLPHFCHKDSHEVPWVNNFYKSAWVDAQLAALDRHPASTSNRSLTPETVSKLCQQGQLSEAVEALRVLVHTDCRPSKSLLYTVLKTCVVKKDLLLCRRVHTLIVNVGHQSDTFLCNHLIRMYASHARLHEAIDVFTVVAKPDAFTWSSIISAHVTHGQAKQAIQLYHQMRSSSVKPDGHVFVAALQACASGADLKSGQQVHADVLASGVEPDLFVCNSLVDMYAKCGSLADARTTFDNLAVKDVVTWNAMIAGYAQQGMGQEALILYTSMQQQGITPPDSVTFVCVLQACASVAALHLGKQLHTQIEERGFQADVVVGNSLLSMYAKCGSLGDARSVFDTISQKNVVTWNAMIAGYAQQGMGQEALTLYNRMPQDGISAPNSVTFVCLLQACASMGMTAMDRGRQLHAQIEERGLQAEVVVANSLINMYAKCGCPEDAQRVFDRTSQKNVVTWNALIAGYAQQGMAQEALTLYNRMQEEGSVPNLVTFVCLLQACASVGVTALKKGKQLHAQIEERGIQADVFVTNSLINMYARCGSLEHAQSMFDGSHQKDVVTWNALIAGYVQQGMGQEALRLYNRMLEEDISAPDSVTFVSLLQACASVGITAMETGKQLHAQAEERGLQADVGVGCSLVNMYARCGSLGEAQSMFDGLRKKDVVVWNAMIAGYVQQGMCQEALSLYSRMQREAITAPDSVTFVCLLQACASLAALQLGRQLHGQIGDQGLQADVFVANSLINMYAKCGSLEDAQCTFDGLCEKDVVTWNALIAGYVQQGMGQEALSLYSRMQQEGITAPDSVTFVCLLQACATLAALHPGSQLHAHIEEQGLQTDVFVAKSLIHMYAKSGSMVDAQQVFDALPKRDIVAWNALIAGYTRQGDTDVVFDLVHRMRDDCIQPNGITYLSVLTVCSHAGLVNKGQEYFEAMSKYYSITPTVEHYTCLVDLLGRAGQLEEALAMVRTMPVEPNDAVWHTLLSACRKWSNLEVGQQAFDEAVKIDEKDAAAYVMMSNIYTSAQMWEKAQEMQARRKEIGAWKQPGQSSWTDMGGKVHAFGAGDEKHPESEGIYARLKQCK